MRKLVWLIAVLYLFLAQALQAQTVRPLTDILLDLDDADVATVLDIAEKQAALQYGSFDRGPLYKSCPPRENRNPSDVTDEKIFEGIFVPASNRTTLAIFSDDGCSVWINGEPVLTNYAKPQHLPRLTESFHILKESPGSNKNFPFKKNKEYRIRVRYSNTIFLGKADIDGCTLFAFEGEPVVVEVYEFRDKNGNVFASPMDLKVDGPVKVRFRVLGVEGQQVLEEWKIEILDDETNEGHVELYGAGAARVVRTLSGKGADATPVAGRPNAWEVPWDGRDKAAKPRLLIAGKFGFKPEVKLAQAGKLAGEKRQAVVAKPNSGHFAADWPRSSAELLNDPPLPPNASLAAESPQRDDDLNDNVYPTRDATYERDEDGFWFTMRVVFQWDNPNQKWRVYTPSGWALSKGKKEKELKQPGDVPMTIEEIKYNARYPTKRLAFIARFEMAANRYRFYRHENFWNQDGYINTGKTVTAGNSVWLSFDGSDNQDLRIKIVEKKQPADRDEFAVLVFPAVDGKNGKYNVTAERKNLMTLKLSDFDETLRNDQFFQLRVNRGYGLRKFWDLRVNGAPAGVDRSADALNGNGYRAVGYDRANPASADDYGNLQPDDAMNKWRNRCALVEVGTHAGPGFLGWYAGTYTADAPNVNDKDQRQELYRLSHKFWLDANEGRDVDANEDKNPVIKIPANLDDVFLFAADGCDCALVPKKKNMTDPPPKSLPQAITDAGVDVVMSWSAHTTEDHALWFRFFLEESLKKGKNDQYPTMVNAAKAATTRLATTLEDRVAADEVLNHLEWSGKVANSQNQKLFPLGMGGRTSRVYHDSREQIHSLPVFSSRSAFVRGLSARPESTCTNERADGGSRVRGNQSAGRVAPRDRVRSRRFLLQNLSVHAPLLVREAIRPLSYFGEVENPTPCFLLLWTVGYVPGRCRSYVFIPQHVEGANG